MIKEYDRLIDEFIEKNMNSLKDDLKSLIDIKSVAGEPVPDAPHGTGVYKALRRALELTKKYGLTPVDCEGQIGYAHYGSEDKFIGIVGHLDVVPEGEGWNTDPYSMTECDGYLLGRGTLDDKGGFVIGLYTAKFLIENKVPLKYGLRLIGGCDEETGMSDIVYYKNNCKLPALTLVPDTDFPVCNGEKGIYSGNLVSKTPLSGAVKELKGGVASNVVPEKAHAVIDCLLADAQKAAEGAKSIAVSGEDHNVTIMARGVTAHAGYPKHGVNAIVLLCKFLSESGLVPEGDAALLAAIGHIFEVTDGSHLDIAADDGIFTPLTCIGGMIKLDGDRHLVQNFNIRYPTNSSDAIIYEAMSRVCGGLGFALDDVHGDNGPFYVPADSPVISTLIEACSSVTGKKEEPYVMSGGTYARFIPGAVAFGPHFIEPRPDFVGDVHCKNEGVAVEDIRKGLKIYIRALLALQEIEL